MRKMKSSRVSTVGGARGELGDLWRHQFPTTMRPGLPSSCWNASLQRVPPSIPFTDPLPPFMDVRRPRSRFHPPLDVSFDYREHAPK